MASLYGGSVDFAIIYSLVARSRRVAIVPESAYSDSCDMDWIRRWRVAIIFNNLSNKKLMIMDGACWYVHVPTDDTLEKILNDLNCDWNDSHGWSVHPNM